MLLPSTLFYLRQKEKLLVLVVSPPRLSFPNLCQGHHRQGSRQALPPRVLHVRRLRAQPEAEGVFLH